MFLASIHPRGPRVRNSLLLFFRVRALAKGTNQNQVGSLGFKCIATPVLLFYAASYHHIFH